MSKDVPNWAREVLSGLDRLENILHQMNERLTGLEAHQRWSRREDESAPETQTKVHNTIDTSHTDPEEVSTINLDVTEEFLEEEIYEADPILTDEYEESMREWHASFTTIKSAKYSPDHIWTSFKGIMGEASGKAGRAALEMARSAAFKLSEDLDEERFVKIGGYDFNRGLDLMELLRSMGSTGFQASNLGDAMEIVNQMLDWRLSHEELAEDCNEEECGLAFRETIKCKIFLGFTSNLISSGVREMIRFLVEHRMVDVVVTTAGGIEEDLIKCLAPTYKGDFTLPGALLRSKGLNRIGNLLVPNNNYCKFEDWIIPIFDQMLQEQITENVLWTPSKLIARLGKEINDPSSYLFWAFKNNIPVFCPGITDGSLGDMLYFHSFCNPGLVIDIVQDIRAMNSEAVHASPRKTGIIILGGGLPKHHICNANMMRNGADYAVYINTAQEFDGSDSGAHPDEAVSWGKIRGSAKAVKVHCDATIAFPLLVAGTFARRVEKTALHD